MTGNNFPAVRKPVRRLKPQVEALEDRNTPSTIVALTSADELITFDSADPTRLLSTVKITGLAANEDLVGIDARPANGILYGVSNRNQVYILNSVNGAATKIGGPLALSLNGLRFGVDFNPTVDRIRVVNDAEQNLRLNPNDGTVVDGDTGTIGIQPDTGLKYAPGDPSALFTPDIVAAAYTNNFLGATSTTLYVLDHARNTLVRQGGLGVPPGTPSPNGGQLFTVGALGVNFGGRTSFDIAADGTAYASLRPMNGNGPTQLATIDLATGKATLRGLIGTGATIEGLAVLPREEVLYGVTVSNKLISFRADNPGSLLRSLPITGLNAGENIIGLDVRPATGELFALTSTNRVVRINPVNGQAIQTGNPIDPTLFQTNLKVGLDFNPTVDRLRLGNDGDDNLRFNPVNFTPVDGNAGVDGIQPDGKLMYITGDPGAGTDPSLVAVAYDRNDNDLTTPTTLFGIDSVRNTLVRQGAVDGNAADIAGGGSPNGGLLTTIGVLNVNPTELVSFDISGVGSGGKGTAIAVLQLEGETVSKVYAINTATGAATIMGTVGGGELVSAMAIAPPSFQFSAPSFTVREGAGKAAITVTRTGGSDAAAQVLFSTSDGTAVAGSDYTATAITLMFAAGETRKTVFIPILNNQVMERTETVQLFLSPGINVTPTMLGDPLTAILSIQDDDTLGLSPG